MKIIYTLHRDRNGGKYVHYNEDFCKKSSGGSHESRYILRIFSKAGLSKDLYSKVYKTCRIRILRAIRGQQCYVGVRLHS